MGTKLSKQEVITRLCELVTNVGGEVFNHRLGHDCFCGINTLPDEHFRVDSEVIEWIEEAIKTHKSYEDNNNC
jgi:hypothetical protein